MIIFVFSILVSGPVFNEPVLTNVMAVMGYSRGSPISFTADYIPGTGLDKNPLLLRSDAAAAWKDMLATAARDGVVLKPTYAFRSHKLQAKIKRTNGRLAAIPGYSPHQTGLAIDIDGTRRRGSQVYKWLKQNASRFNFYQTIQYEKWHFEYKPSEGGKNQ